MAEDDNEFHGTRAELEEQLYFWQCQTEHYKTRTRELQRRIDVEAATTRVGPGSRPGRRQPLAPAALRRLADALHDEADTLEGSTK